MHKQRGDPGQQRLYLDTVFHDHREEMNMTNHLLVLKASAYVSLAKVHYIAGPEVNGVGKYNPLLRKGNKYL